MQNFIKKPLKLAGISGIFLIILSLLAGLLVLLLGFLVKDITFYEIFRYSSIITLVTTIVVLPFKLLFYNGFITLGKKFNNKLLYYSAWVFVAIAIFGLIFSVISFNPSGGQEILDLIYEADSDSPTNSLFYKLLSKSNIYKPFLDFFGVSIILPLVISMLLFSVVLRLVFAIGLIKLDKKQVPRSSMAGYMELLSVILPIVAFIALILEVLIFFDLSKKVENF